MDGRVRWEYTEGHFPPPPYDMGKEANELGSEGWELVAILDPPLDNWGVFKRPYKLCCDNKVVLGMDCEECGTSVQSN